MHKLTFFIIIIMTAYSNGCSIEQYYGQENKDDHGKWSLTSVEINKYP